MAVLFHGTTLRRARQILLDGPRPRVVEPGGPGEDECFCTCLPFGPFPLLPPEAYACAQSRRCPGDGGPAILVVDVPDEVIASTDEADRVLLDQGIVDFCNGRGLEALRDAWPMLQKRVIPFECP